MSRTCFPDAVGAEYEVWFLFRWFFERNIEESSGLVLHHKCKLHVYADLEIILCRDLTDLYRGGNLTF